MCYRPLYLKKEGRYVPCSKCPKCISRRTNSWSFRLQEHEKICESAHFITLTYDTKHIPITPTGRLTVDRRDVQNFIKRLRKLTTGNGPSPIKYYAVGEYGGLTKRPHYHVIMFNANLDYIQPAWKQGDIHYGNVTAASIGYTLKYMCKQKRNKIGSSSNDDRIPEFALMSKGLGISYLNEVNCNWHVEDFINRMYVTAPGGIKISMPRYYRDKLYLENERSALSEAFAAQAHEKALIKMDKQTPKTFRNELAAIDAAYDRMYLKSLKTQL